MMAAADLIGGKQGNYATDYRSHVRGQVAIAAKYDIDYVSAISDPAVEASTRTLEGQTHVKSAACHIEP